MQPEQARKSLRLQGFDYASAGAYFVTIVAKDRALLFEDMRLYDIAGQSWRWLGARYDHVQLDEFVIMPNHVHAILWITDPRRGGSRAAPTASRAELKPLGQLIGAFKTVSAKQINRIRGTPGVPVWQRNFYEHIVRTDDELNRIRQYIIDNPGQWETDAENPANKPSANKAL
jgi:REP element-mobilizing transposase RayT